MSIRTEAKSRRYSLKSLSSYLRGFFFLILIILGLFDVFLRACCYSMRVQILGLEIERTLEKLGFLMTC